MITCKLQGGLGNQLFQIFTTIEYALTNSKPFFFLNNCKLGNGENNSTIRYTYWDTFLSELNPFLKNVSEIPKLLFVKEKNFNYEILPKNFKDGYGTILIGYFQSPLYFDKYKDLICKLIKLDNKKNILKDKLLNKYIYNNFENTISIHFRLGDYKKYPEIYPILSELYYNNSLTHILNKTTNKILTVLYFCEEEDINDVINIITCLQEKFTSCNFCRATSLLDDWEQLLLMSLCSYNIIANSTFSWWGAYFNNNSNKIVCYPEEWFTKNSQIDTVNLFPDDWVKISC
jgi:hypothetical protein